MSIRLIILTLLLLGLSIVMMLSSSVEFSNQLTHQPFYFFAKQLIFIVIGLAILVFFCLMPIKFLHRHYRVFLLLVWVALCLLLIPGIGIEVKGSTRWLSVGFFRLQPSELMKLIFIIFLSAYFARRHNQLKQSVRPLLGLIIVISICGVLLLFQPDYGSFFILCALSMTLLFIAGLPLRWFLLCILLAGVLLFLLVFTSEYRLNRLTAYFDPWDDPLGSDYQISNALIALGRGGWFGVGPGESLQKLLYIPDAYTDFLFAIIVEEFGFLGGLGVVFLYALILLYSLQIAKLAMKQPDQFAFFLAYGIGVWIFLQAIINMGVNVGLLPTKGLTLPFLSYGGSSLLTYMAAMGILVRIDIENRLFAKRPLMN